MGVCYACLRVILRFQHQRFSLTNVSRLLDTRKDTVEKKTFTYFPVRKGLFIDDVRVSRDTAFREIRPGACFKTGDLVQEKLGGLPQNDS